MTPEPIDAETIHSHLSEHGVSLTAVRKALKMVSHKEYYDIYRSVLKVSVWNKADPINGVSASHVLESRRDVTDEHNVILVADGSGRVMYFQPVLESEDLKSLQEKYLHEMAMAHANSAVASMVSELLVRADGNGNTVKQ